MPLRELAAIDGAFVVNRRGAVDSAGTYLNVTDATAVVISASSGTVSVYDGGVTVLELERTAGHGRER